MKHLDSLSPGDRAAVYTTSGIVMQDFTDDRAKLRATLLRINPNPIGSTPTTDCPYITPYQANLIVNVHDPMALQVAVSDYGNCMNMNVQASMAQSVVVSSAERVVSASSDQSRIALGTIRDVVNRIAQMPGPRTIVLVSPGFLLIDNTRPGKLRSSIAPSARTSLSARLMPAGCTPAMTSPGETRASRPSQS